MALSGKIAIFPIFEECKKYTLDRFWLEWFTNFAHNKFPPGVKYDDKHQSIIVKINGAREVVSLPETAEAVFTVMMDVMKKLGLKSTRDLKIEKVEIENIKKQRKVDLDCEFKKIKPKNLKDQLIMNYIISLKEKYNLNATEYNNVVSVIQLGFQFKSISSDDVVYENSKIMGIKGLMFNKITRVFSLPSYAKMTVKPEKISTVDKFSTTFNRFIKNNKARVQKYNV